MTRTEAMNRKLTKLRQSEWAPGVYLLLTTTRSGQYMPWTRTVDPTGSLDTTRWRGQLFLYELVGDRWEAYQDQMAGHAA